MMSSTYYRYSTAKQLFEQKHYTQAADILRDLLDGLKDNEVLHATTDARLLLARSYYHSAQLGRAEDVVRDLLIDVPHEPYAQLLLGRILQRTGRPEAARGHLTMARLLGDYEV